MKRIPLIILYVFAIIYLIFGLNFFLGFIPLPPLEGNAAAYMGLLGSTGYMASVKVLEIISALMILSGFRRPLAVLMLLPVSVNILMYDVFMVGLPTLGLVMVLMNVYLVYFYRQYFGGIVK